MRRAAANIVPLLNSLCGWMYLAAGAAVLAAAAVIPAQRELDRARELGDGAEAQVAYRERLLDDAGTRLAALAEPSEALLVSLAQTHLNLAPAGATPLRLPIDRPRAVLVAETAAEPEPAPRRVSMLERLVTTRPARGLVIVAGAVCVLFGLLPEGQRRAAGSGATP